MLSIIFLIVITLIIILVDIAYIFEYNRFIG